MKMTLHTTPRPHTLGSGAKGGDTYATNIENLKTSSKLLCLIVNPIFHGQFFLKKSSAEYLMYIFEK